MYISESNYFNRLIAIWFHVLVTSRVAMTVAGTICVSMVEPALRSVSPQVYGTVVPVQSCLLGNIARLSREVVRITKQPALTHLDCTKSLMVVIKPSQCSVTLTQSLISLGT